MRKNAMVIESYDYSYIFPRFFFVRWYHNPLIPLLPKAHTAFPLPSLSNRSRMYNTLVSIEGVLSVTVIDFRNEISDSNSNPGPNSLCFILRQCPLGNI